MINVLALIENFERELNSYEVETAPGKSSAACLETDAIRVLAELAWETGDDGIRRRFALLMQRATTVLKIKAAQMRGTT